MSPAESGKAAASTVKPSLPLTRQGKGPVKSSAIDGIAKHSSARAQNDTRAPCRRRVVQCRVFSLVSELEGKGEPMHPSEILHIGIGIVEIRFAGHGHREMEAHAAREPFRV